MRAFLHQDLRLAGKTLLDTTLGLRYSLSPDAAWLIKQLKSVSQLDKLVPIVAHSKWLSEFEARRDIYNLLGQLAAFGTVVVEWGRSFGWGLRFKAWLTWSTRQPSTFVGLAWATWRAYGLLAIGFELTFAVFAVIYGLKLPLALWVAPFVLFGSLVVHELGHVVMAHWRQVPAVLLSRLGHIALLYKRPVGAGAQHIAAAGPLLVLLVCALATLLVNHLLVRLGLLAVALAHAMCLLPFTADGRTLWRRA